VKLRVIIISDDRKGLRYNNLINTEAPLIIPCLGSYKIPHSFDDESGLFDI
jgi:hypothetical protein